MTTVQLPPPSVIRQNGRFECSCKGQKFYIKIVDSGGPDCVKAVCVKCNRLHELGTLD